MFIKNKAQERLLLGLPCLLLLGVLLAPLAAPTPVSDAFLEVRCQP